jgi:hypothetical protein
MLGANIGIHERWGRCAARIMPATGPPLRGIPTSPTSPDPHGPTVREGEQAIAWVRDSLYSSPRGMLSRQPASVIRTKRAFARSSAAVWAFR